MSARVGVVVFPGTNCELDVVWAVEHLGGEAELLWHGDESVHGVDAVVVPGGFAHGDYLRTGAIARFSPVMNAVAEHAASGGVVLGICNGFQVLTEAGLLPGALQKNAGLAFVCDTVTLEQLRDEDRVILRYVDNPNGSIDDIAGITSPAGNVVGLMPHPERASDLLLGSDDGVVLLQSLLAAAADRAAARV
jgi:phosphoribosylformylglycinamidine synthase